jgi:hypothetical protein
VETITFVYDGPIETIVIRLPSGRTPEVSRGETFDAIPSEVDALDALPDWTRTAPINDSAADDKPAAKKESK